MNEEVKNSAAAKAELRDRIVHTAMEAFTRNGIKMVTMDDIANSLSISKRTLYEVFKDKEDLLVTCMTQHREEMHQYVLQIERESENVLEVILKFYQRSIEIYHKTNKRFFEDMSKYPRVHQLMTEDRNENQAEVIAFFKKGIQQGIFRKDINFEITQMLVQVQVDLIMNTDLCNTYSFIEVFDSIMFIYMRGISTEKGQRILEDFIRDYRKQKTNVEI